MLCACGFSGLGNTYAASASIGNDNVLTYHRADFNMIGSDCPVCLARISSKIKKLPGVIKASIWPWTPHYGVIVYDAAQTQWNTIVQSVSDEKVFFQDIKDVVLSPEQLRVFIDAQKTLK